MEILLSATSNTAFLNPLNRWMFPKQTERKYRFIVIYNPLSL